MSDNKPTQTGQSTPEWERPWFRLIMGSMFLLIGVLVVTQLGQFVIEVGRQTDQQQTADPNIILERADDAVSSAQLILSFLEGASILLVVGLGGAAFVGYRNSQEARRDLRDEKEELSRLRDEIQQEALKFQQDTESRVAANLGETRGMFEFISKFEKPLNDLPAALDELYAVRQELYILRNSFIEITSDLLQANQELNLKNYDIAYEHVTQVLSRSPNIVQALYIAGWLELQFITDKLDEGLRHLEEAKRLNPESLSIIAAYGVGLRRKALTLTGKDRIDKLKDARFQLERALEKNPNLIDFNRESFWGPLAGTYRDLGDLDRAIEYYKNAQTVTPNSSYPAGNLAHLYLQKSDDDAVMLDTALDAFARTDEMARAELLFMPGDYFAMMDIAMAKTMLGQRDKAQFAESEEWLEAALKMEPTPGMLRVSLGGWERLIENCPPKWKDVHQHLQAAIAIVDGLLKSSDGAA